MLRKTKGELRRIHLNGGNKEMSNWAPGDGMRHPREKHSLPQWETLIIVQPHQMLSSTILHCVVGHLFFLIPPSFFLTKASKEIKCSLVNCPVLPLHLASLDLTNLIH